MNEFRNCASCEKQEAKSHNPVSSTTKGIVSLINHLHGLLIAILNM